MLMKRFYDTKLAQASYLIGCQATGDAIVIDANRDAAQYINAAAAEGVRITHVTETHIHADFISGSLELAQRTAAQLLLSDEGDAQWKYAFATASDARLLKNGDVIMVGNIKLDVLHTPGHTPEHLAFLVTDTPASAGPMGIVTGDFLFVGDVGRPDLLEKAAGHSGTMGASARTLFRSLQQVKQLPDHLQIWPGHGAGSACGKALGAVPTSTLGYEKVANWGLKTTDEEVFVATVLADQPEPPKYFAEMKRINKLGPSVLGARAFARPARLDHSKLKALLDARGFVIDTRNSPAFAIVHIAGTINIPLNKSFTTWAGWLIPFDRDFTLIVDAARESEIDEAIRDLAMIGLDRLVGYASSDVIDDWRRAGQPVDSLAQISVTELQSRFAHDPMHVIDVRGRAEWNAGHLPNSANIPLGYLTEHLTKLPKDEPIVLQCQGGGRSSIAASVLRANGFSNVLNLSGGFSAWSQQGLPIQHEGEVAAGSER
jgi:hydroxyacylglutathione hydrolase